VDSTSCLRHAEQTIEEHSNGLPKDKLLGGLRVATQFRAADGQKVELPLGASRFGGLPDLPASVEWPRWDGYSQPDLVLESGRRVAQGCRPSALSFLAQLNLSETPNPTRLLPETGWLCFFFDTAQQPWGFDPRHRGSARVIYFDTDPALLQRIDAPADAEVIPSTEILSELAATLPRRAHPLGLKLGEPESDAYYDLAEERLAGKKPHHRLLGWPMQIQGDMDRECQLVTHGIHCGSSEGYRSAEARRLEDGVKDWLMLLQLDTDEEGPGWMWGDAGCLYFWIRKQDLAERRFESSWAILQCY